jgi:hypothetical protein
VLFFQEAEKSLEGVCYGVFLYQLWLRLITLHTLWITSQTEIEPFEFHYRRIVFAGNVHQSQGISGFSESPRKGEQIE